MPFCNTSKPGEASSSAGNGIKIFYQTYGRGQTKVLLIIGLAGTHDSWGPQIKALAGTDEPNEDDRHDVPDYENEDGIEVCAFDNRGMGRSSVPTKKSEYTCPEHLPSRLIVGSITSKLTFPSLGNHCRGKQDNEKLRKIDSFFFIWLSSFLFNGVASSNASA